MPDTISSRELDTQPVYQEQARLLSESWIRGQHLEHEEVDSEATLGRKDSRHRLYFKRLGAKALGQLLINTANTLGILVLVLSLGFWVITDDAGNWSRWLTYLVALRYFLSSLQGVAQSLVQSSRYVRQARRYIDFVAAARIASSQADVARMACPDHLINAFQGGNETQGAEDADDEDQ